MAVLSAVTFMGRVLTPLSAHSPLTHRKAAAFSGWSQGGYWSQSWGLNGLVLTVVSGKLVPTVSRKGRWAGARAALAISPATHWASLVRSQM
jgi:hypothetical protein